ncbi:hypothetical protein RRG08_029874 [Elysia crispata]|uniref:Uncharacterized protein n=1 Tax=Elysia crispata TaxID=231223 RepID=A0AAE1CZR1_9GAST|nr:hypothetical protein RRG08_029874 [Elysia crispata]
MFYLSLPRTIHALSSSLLGSTVLHLCSILAYLAYLQEYPSPPVIKASELPKWGCPRQYPWFPAIEGFGAKPNGQHDKAYHFNSGTTLPSGQLVSPISWTNVG